MLANLAGSLREIKQKLEFLGCQMNFLLTNQTPVRLRINAKSPISITSGTASRRRSCGEDGTNAR